MSRTKQRGSRAEREAQLGQYEIPAFAAGAVKGRQQTIIALAEAFVARHGSNPYIQRIIEEARAAELEAAVWQRLAAQMTGYPYTRKEA